MAAVSWAALVVLDDLQEGAHQLKNAPPSTTSDWPVMKSASGEQKKATAPTMSSGNWSRWIEPRLERDLLQLLDLHRVREHAVRHREAGRDGVDEDAVAADLLGHRARHRDHGALARDVVEQERHALVGRARGDVDDAPVAGGAHRGHDRAGREEHAEHVDVVDLAPLVDADLLERLGLERAVDARVVDQPVDAAVALERRGGHGLGVGLLRDVDGHAQAAELGRGGLGAREVGDHDGRALLVQPASRSRGRSPWRRR